MGDRVGGGKLQIGGWKWACSIGSAIGILVQVIVTL